LIYTAGGENMNSWLCLLIAIVAEVIGTSALKASDGFSRLRPSALTIVAYGISFYFLSLTLRAIPVGVAYAVWSGVGIILVTMVGWLYFDQRLDTPAIIGMALIVSGALVLNLFSKTIPH
jgi:small multidrug resistance pump